MMHFGPWIHHHQPKQHEQQRLLDNHQYYSIIPAVYHQQDRSNEHHQDEESAGYETHETMTSATSGDRSSSADLFKLEFAAAQWSKLVLNAEGLFTKLVTSNILPHTEQDQIEQWLCMKQEYEECIASDDTASLHGYPENARRSLERIAEVTETDEKTDEESRDYKDESTASDSDASSEELEDEEDDDEIQSDIDSENPDFLDKLDECMKKFKYDTDEIVNAERCNYKRRSSEGDFMAIQMNKTYLNNNKDDCVPPIVKPIPVRNQNSRRNSMLPGSVMSNEVLAFNGLRNDQYCMRKSLDIPHEVMSTDEFTKLGAATRYKNDSEKFSRYNGRQDSTGGALEPTLQSNEETEPIKALKILTMKNVNKQSQIRKVLCDMDDVNKKVEELQTIIKNTEKCKADIMENSEGQSNSRLLSRRRNSKVNDDCDIRKLQMAQVALLSKNENLSKRDSERSEGSDVYEMKRMGKKLQEVSRDSSKIQELEASLNSAKVHMEKLKKQLIRAEERKAQLEEELITDQKKIKELEEKCNLTASKLKEIQSESENDETKTQPDASNSVGEYNPDKVNKSKNLSEVSARISYLDHVLKDKSMELEKIANTDEREAIKHEIYNLRRAREDLVDEMSNLKGAHKDEPMSTNEERRFLECGETIEVIDEMIEHKNEKMCGKKEFDYGKGARTLMEQLVKLSDNEVRLLFYKYYCKIIDVKHNATKGDQAIRSLDYENQSCKREIIKLANLLESNKKEFKKKIESIQKRHEENVRTLLKNHNDYSRSYREGGDGEHSSTSPELSKYKKENRMLKKQVADLEAQMNGNVVAHRTTSPPRNSQFDSSFKQVALHPKNSRPKVTREKNKVIIHN